MEIVKLTTTVNATGRLHIDIPTRLSPGKVQAEEIGDVARFLFVTTL